MAEQNNDEETKVSTVKKVTKKKVAKKAAVKKKVVPKKKSVRKKASTTKKALPQKKGTPPTAAVVEPSAEEATEDKKTTAVIKISSTSKDISSSKPDVEKDATNNAPPPKIQTSEPVKTKHEEIGTMTSETAPAAKSGSAMGFWLKIILWLIIIGACFVYIRSLAHKDQAGTAQHSDSITEAVVETAIPAESEAVSAVPAVPAVEAKPETTAEMAVEKGGEASSEAENTSTEESATTETTTVVVETETETTAAPAASQPEDVPSSDETAAADQNAPQVPGWVTEQERQNNRPARPEVPEWVKEQRARMQQPPARPEWAPQPNYGYSYTPGASIPEQGQGTAQSSAPTPAAPVAPQQPYYAPYGGNGAYAYPPAPAYPGYGGYGYGYGAPPAPYAPNTYYYPQ